MEPQRVVLLLPPEAQALLDDNGIDLVEQLNRRGLQVERGHGHDPVTEGEGQSRDVVTVILASAGLVTAIGAAVCMVLEALGRNKSFIADEVELTPVVDSAGAPVVGKDGEPVLYWKNTKKLIEARGRDSDSSVEISGPGIRIKQTAASHSSARR
jgi:hypothetical protein